MRYIFHTVGNTRAIIGDDRRIVQEHPLSRSNRRIGNFRDARRRGRRIGRGRC